MTRQSPSGRRHRFVRSRANIHLTPDDLAIVNCVARFRFLRSTHLISLLPHRPRKKLIERLGQLYHAGFLDRPRAQLNYYARSGSAPMVYALGNLSAGIANSGNAGWSQKNRSATRPYLEHTLFIADILIAIELAVRTRSDLDFLDANALRELHGSEERVWKLPAEIFFGRGRIRFSVIPDAVFALRSKATGKCVYFFLEADRATMTIENADLSRPSYARKLLGYHTALTARLHTERFGFPNARVLSVTTSLKRVRSMLRALQSVTKLPTGRFLFTDWPSLSKADPISFAWHTNSAPASIDFPSRAKLS